MGALTWAAMKPALINGQGGRRNGEIHIFGQGAKAQKKTLDQKGRR